MSTREQHVRSVLDPDHAIKSVRQPFVAGDWWVATDSRALVAYPAMPGDPPGGTKASVREGVAGWLEASEGPSLTTTVAALREWAVLGPDLCPECKGVRAECPDCDGAGEIDCECLCGDEHWHDCKECGGRGWAKCRACGSKESERIMGVLMGRTFNLAVVHRALEHAPDGDVTVYPRDLPHGSLIVGDPWRALVMPLDDRIMDPADRAKAESRTFAPEEVATP